MYDQNWYSIESTEADSRSWNTAFCQTQLDVDAIIVGYSNVITKTDANGNISWYSYETACTDLNKPYFLLNHYSASGNLAEFTYTYGPKPR